MKLILKIYPYLNRVGHIYYTTPATTIRFFSCNIKAQYDVRVETDRRLSRVFSFNSYLCFLLSLNTGEKWCSKRNILATDCSQKVTALFKAL